MRSSPIGHLHGKPYSLAQPKPQVLFRVRLYTQVHDRAGEPRQWGQADAPQPAHLTHRARGGHEARPLPCLGVRGSVFCVAEAHAKGLPSDLKRTMAKSIPFSDFVAIVAPVPIPGSVVEGRPSRVV